MKGKLIVIEGVDSSGKATHSELLYQKLKSENYPVMKLTFPDYESNSSALVKMYLGGEFGSNPDDVSPYIASTFYAADRFASYRTKWQEFYLSGGIIVADRYVTSNMVHQAAKIPNDTEKNSFLDWLYDLEYNIYQIPQPDITVFLDMPPHFAEQLMKSRNNKITGNAQKDIHESSREHIEKAYNNACEIAKKFDWTHIACVSDGEIRAIDEIQKEIADRVGCLLRNENE